MVASLYNTCTEHCTLVRVELAGAIDDKWVVSALAEPTKTDAPKFLNLPHTIFVPLT